MTRVKIRRKRATKELQQMPLDTWILFSALAHNSILTRSQLSAFLREARKRKLVQHKLEEHTLRPLWKRIAPIVQLA